MPRARRSSHPFVVITVALLAATAALWLLTLSGLRTELLTLVTTIVSAITAIVTLANVLHQHRQSPAPSQVSAESILKRTVNELCRGVENDIKELRDHLELNRGLLDVTWRTVGPAPDDVPAEGNLQVLAQRFARLPPERQRLLLLGAPASGKTVYAALLALNLLKSSHEGTTIPIVLRFALWERSLEPDVSRWLVDQIERTYAGNLDWQLLFEAPGNRILPILDGIDEIGPELLPRALDELDLSLGDNAPLVVVCRSDLYEKAVEAGGKPLENVWTIKLRPLREEAVADYLAGKTEKERDWWRPVVDEVSAKPASSLAVLLRNPFNTWLAKRLYPHSAAAERRPAELVTAAEVQDLLLTRFIPSALGAARDRTGRLLEFTVPGATRWLRFLARHLRRRGEDDLAWWELRTALPRLLAELVTGVVAGLAYGPLLLLGHERAVGAGVGAAFGVLFGYTFCLAYSATWNRGPRDRRRGGGGFRDNCSPRTAARRLGEGLAVVLTAWVIALVFVAVDGGLATLVIGPWWGLPVVVAGAAVIALTFGAAIGSLAAQLLRAMTSYATLATVRATTPDETVARDRRSSAVCFLMFTVIIGLLTGAALAILSTDPVLLAVTSIGGGLAGGVTAVMMFFAWPPYQVRHFALAVARRLPWRFTGFLRLARDVGILRQSGAHYQFRHRILRDHLAKPLKPVPPPGAG